MSEDKIEPRVATLEAGLLDLRVEVMAIRRFIGKNHPELVSVLDGLRDEVARELKGGR